MAIDATEQIEKFQEFIEQSYQKQLHENLNKGHNYLLMDFFELTKYDPKLADQLLYEPEETIKAAEMALEQFDVKKGFRVRFRNLPKSEEIYIRNLRSKHLSRFIAMEGIIRQSSEVRPQAVSAKFECPSCGNTLTMPQIDQQFREPTRCSCGRKGKFRLLSKELVDVQRLVIEESPENLEGGAQPKRMQIFLREDLVEPRMEKRTTPGTRILVNGALYEVPIQTKTGATSTRFDLAMQANYIEPVEEDYSEINITPEDEKEIKKLAKDKDIHNRIIRSIAPSIYGHERIKEAILLQLFGGIRKTKKDGTIVRGDLHVLLVGDPGAGKSQMLTFVNNTAPKSRYVAGRSASGAGLCVSPNSRVLTNHGEIKIKELVEKHLLRNSKKYQEGIWIAKKPQTKYSIFTLKDDVVIEGKIDQFWRIKSPEKLLSIKTQSGKKLVLTLATKLFSKKNSSWLEARNLILRDSIAIHGTSKNFIWDKIIEKELISSPYDYVYDLTVEDSHNFVVDGVLVHNTCSVVKDEFLRGWALEAGAMVLADKGILVLDEMDKISKEDTSALHEAMEQQSYHPEFRMMFADGSVEKIGSFVDTLFEMHSERKILGKDCEILPISGVEVLTTDFQKIFPTNVNRVSRHKAPDYFVEVLFSHGRKVVVTPEHPFFVFQAGKYVEIAASQLKEGLFVPAPRKRILLKQVMVASLNGEIIQNQESSSDLRFVTVKKIRTFENKDVDWVYDITVEPTQTFISEGLVLHNSISVAKANIQATLRTQTSILAAANPKLGRFDPFTPIPNQIDMPPALINRFDLIFVIRDIPNKELDGNIAGRVLQSHAYKDVKPELEAKFIRKYLAYAKQKIFPVLTDQAVETIKKFYVELRSTGSTADGAIKPIPISARQLEAIVRLAEASARIKLKKEVEEEDALRAISLMKYCMTEVGMDPETGKIDIDRMTTGISASARGRIIDVKEVLYALSEEKQGGPISIEDDLKPKVFEKGITEKKLEDAIDMLKRSGDFYEPKKGWLQKI